LQTPRDDTGELPEQTVAVGKFLRTLREMADGARGNHLHYGQAFTPETGSAVTFTSMVFE